MASLVGSWQFVGAENLDGYMQAAGIPDQLREVAKNSKPALEVSNSGNSWTLKTTVSDRVKDTTFTLGEEFESKSLTGETMKCNVVMDGEKMTETQKMGDVSIVITREVVGGELVSVMTVNGVSATVKFKKA